MSYTPKDITNTENKNTSYRNDGLSFRSIVSRKTVLMPARADLVKISSIPGQDAYHIYQQSQQYSCHSFQWNLNVTETINLEGLWFRVRFFVSSDFGLGDIFMGASNVTLGM